MSKRAKNYPDPMEVIARHGADALRLYLINSPVVRAQNLRFTESGVHEVVKDVFLPWYNALRFLFEVRLSDGCFCFFVFTFYTHILGSRIQFSDSVYGVRKNEQL